MRKCFVNICIIITLFKTVGICAKCEIDHLITEYNKITSGRWYRTGDYLRYGTSGFDGRGWSGVRPGSWQSFGLSTLGLSPGQFAATNYIVWKHSKRRIIFLGIKLLIGTVKSAARPPQLQGIHNSNYGALHSTLQQNGYKMYNCCRWIMSGRASPLWSLQGLRRYSTQHFWAIQCDWGR